MILFSIKFFKVRSFLFLVMVNQELINYLKNGLSQGKSVDYLRSELTKAGWPSSLIFDAVQAVSVQKTSLPKQPALEKGPEQPSVQKPFEKTPVSSPIKAGSSSEEYFGYSAPAPSKLKLSSKHYIAFGAAGISLVVLGIVLFFVFGPGGGERVLTVSEQSGGGSASVASSGSSTTPLSNTSSQSIPSSGDFGIPSSQVNALGSQGSAVCENGVLEAGETCDGNCPTNCTSSSSCVSAVLYGSAPSCTSQCVLANITSCVSGDGCCPFVCNGFTDSDCSGGQQINQTSNQSSGQGALQSCSSQGGSVCPSGQSCSGSIVSASDTSLCCIGTCESSSEEDSGVAPPPPPPSM